MGNLNCCLKAEEIKDTNKYVAYLIPEINNNKVKYNLTTVKMFLFFYLGKRKRKIR